MKYSQTKLNRAVASLKSIAQDGITNAPNGDISKGMAEEIMIILDRLAKLETMVQQRPDKPMVTKLEDAQ